MDMKKLIESMDHIEECGMDEGPMGMPPAPEMDRGNPVTMNVSLNASGKDHVADLLDMMKNAGLQQAAPVSAKMLSPRMDMERLRAAVDSDMGKEEIDADEGYANEPEEEYGDIEDVTASGDDLHKSKKGYKAAAGGDNPMAMEDIKSALYAALAEKKAKPDYIDIDGDGDKEEPMKKAVKDKEAKKNESKTEQGADGPYYQEQRAKEMAKKDGKDWSRMSYGDKEDYRAKVKKAG